MKDPDAGDYWAGSKRRVLDVVTKMCEDVREFRDGVCMVL